MLSDYRFLWVVEVTPHKCLDDVMGSHPYYGEKVDKKYYIFSTKQSNVSSNICLKEVTYYGIFTQIAKFMGPTWGPPGSCRPQMGSMLAPWTLPSGQLHRVRVYTEHCDFRIVCMVLDGCQTWIITWLRGFLARNCSGCPWRRNV